MNIIQIGCHDGNDKVSNFLNANKKHFSKILLVDASSSALVLAEEFYKDFNGIEFRNVAVIDSNETEIDLFYPVDNANVSYSYLSVLESHVKTHKKFEDDIDNSDPKEINTQKVVATRINNLLEHFDGEYIDRLYIDVEGLDCQIINDIDLDKYDIGYIRFEYIHSEGTFKTNGPILEKTTKRLASFGYSIFADANSPEDLFAIKNI